LAIDIFITSFQRKEFTKETLQKIMTRTAEGTYNLHIFDNGSDAETKEYLKGLLDSGILTSLHLDSRNTGCSYNKSVFHALSDNREKYYVVTDNDIFPPKLNPDWLSRMVEIMDKNPHIALLTPQLPPQGLQMPYGQGEEVIYCKAVGNTFKMVRRDAFPFMEYNNELNTFGDDGQVSKLVHDKGFKVAFCKDIYCFHAGQCENWGYTSEELDQDPRKAGYGKPFIYKPVDMDTYEPPKELKIC
jgi:GT2 family glycosyltransferase